MNSGNAKPASGANLPPLSAERAQNMNRMMEALRPDWANAPRAQWVLKWALYLLNAVTYDINPTFLDLLKLLHNFSTMTEAELMRMYGGTAPLKLLVSEVRKAVREVGIGKDDWVVILNKVSEFVNPSSLGPDRGT